jgi:hypothetical protein
LVLQPVGKSFVARSPMKLLKKAPSSSSALLEANTTVRAAIESFSRDPPTTPTTPATPGRATERHARGVSLAFLRAFVNEFDVAPEEPTWSV